MRIAQVAPLFESVPPKRYGGTERVVSYLTEELVRAGHQVTLFASGDSKTAARLVPVIARALRLDPKAEDTWAPHFVELKEVFNRLDEFDVVHFHTDYLHYPYTSMIEKPTLTTLHGRLNIPELRLIYSRFDTIPVVSISDAQRAPVPMARWIGTVYHGLPGDLFSFHPTPGDYLAFLGRISPEKRVDRAIAIARATGLPLRIAAKVDAADRLYFEREIEPLLDDPLIEFVGEIGEADKEPFLGNALALLFPIDWPEPFGLVMIESLAVGTPVIAFENGSVPEVLAHGKSGFIVRSLTEAVAAVSAISRIDRRACRREFEGRFSAARMARDYLRLYQKVLDQTEGARSGRFQRRAEA